MSKEMLQFSEVCAFTAQTYSCQMERSMKNPQRENHREMVQLSGTLQKGNSGSMCFLRIHGSGSIYFLLRRIGKGGTAEVWKAVKLPGLQICAVKIREKTETEKSEDEKGNRTVERRKAWTLLPLEAEARLLKALTQTSQNPVRNGEFPEFPRFIEYIRGRNHEYLVMEYLRGVTLGEYLRKGNSCSAEEIRELSSHLLAFLEKLHRRTPPVLFLDLTPDNILLDRSGKLRMIDLGAASAWYYREEMAETILYGTPGYAAPELYSGCPGPATDFYNLHVLLELLAACGNTSG